MELAIAAFSPQDATAIRSALVFHPAESRTLSWPGWLNILIVEWKLLKNIPLYSRNTQRHASVVLLLARLHLV